MFVMNEKAFIEKRLNDKNLYKDRGLTSILMKYYLLQGLSDEKVVGNTMNYFRERIINYKEDIEFLRCTLALKKIKKGNISLLDIPYIPISSSEMNIIKSLDNKTHERYLFALLTIAKFKNMVNSENNNWTIKEIGTVFSKIANVNMTQDAQYTLIRELVNRGYINLANGANLNIQVLFIDNADETIKVDSFTDLGKFYADIEKGKMIRCEECGKLVKKGANGRTKYCNECAEKIDREKAILRKK